MKQIVIFLLILLPNNLFAQIAGKNVENFAAGTVLVFQNCDTENVNPGKAGENNVWDFSGLKSKKNDTVTERIVSPKETGYSQTFPKANLVEKYSDGVFVFIHKNEAESHLTGFVDTTNSMTMKYEDPMLLVKRPVEYGDSLTDRFTTEFNTKSINFKGKGKATILADGYGKLILPNASYENVLRVKLTQNTTSIAIKYGSKSTTQTTTYVWFDNGHASALLKISITKSAYYNNKSVQFLLSETNE
jgi:hypothetical protein